MIAPPKPTAFDEPTARRVLQGVRAIEQVVGAAGPIEPQLLSLVQVFEITSDTTSLMNECYQLSEFCRGNSYEVESVTISSIVEKFCARAAHTKNKRIGHDSLVDFDRPWFRVGM